MTMSLSHIRVLDLTTHLSGPWCAMILADHGADVVKVERPDTGDDMRGTPPFVEGESAPFMLWNRNKRSVALNLKDAGDLALFKRLAATADVLIENFKPGTAARIGVGYDAMRTLNPRLVYCSISGFGQTGPYAPRGGFDLIACGMTGLMSINGPPDGPPYRIPVPVTDLCGGMNAAIGVLTALAARERTGPRATRRHVPLRGGHRARGVRGRGGCSPTGRCLSGSARATAGAPPTRRSPPRTAT